MTVKVNGRTVVTVSRGRVGHSVRVAMLPAMLEKVSFALTMPILYALGRVPAVIVGLASMDAIWLVLFVIAYVRTPKRPFPETPKD